jgi:hypothetical protein
VVVVAVLFWARISLLTRLVVYVFTLVVALLWFYFICFDFFFLSLEVVLWLGNILLFLDWTSLLEFLATAFVCYVLGVVSLIFLVSIVLCLLIFKKKKTLWVVLANILGYWVIVCLVLWYLLRMACCCLRSLLF